MTVNEAFDVLAIEETKDESLIKQAYRMKLTVTNPEDNPEGFKRLRQAYEAACAYAKSSDEEEPEVDDTPSGQWVSKAAAIYESLSRRTNPDEWNKLFEDEVYLSLEGEEECGRKLLVYLMSHFYFPTEIWKLIAEKLRIHERSSKLKESFPPEFINYIIRGCTGEGEMDFSYFEGADDAPYDRYIQKYSNGWRAVDENNPELAAQLIEESEQLGIFHPAMEVVRAEMLLKQQKVDEAIECIQKVYDKYPGDLTVAFNYANICWNNDLREKAANAYMLIMEKSEKHYMANLCLAEWYYENKDYEKAKKCAENVMSVGGNDEFEALVTKINEQLEKEYMRKYNEENDIEAATELAWCYLQDGYAFAGIKLSKEIENLIPPDKHTPYLGLITKLYLEETMYEEAVETALEWRKCLFAEINSKDEKEQKADRGRIRQTYTIRAQAFGMMGYADKKYFNSALDEIDELFKLPKEFELEPHIEIPVLFEKGRNLINLDRCEEAVDFLRDLIDNRQLYGSYILLVDAYAKMWSADGVVAAGRQCINYFPQHPRAYEEMGRVFNDLKRSDDLKALLEQAKENGIKSDLLDAYEDRMKKNFSEPVSLSEQVKEFDNTYTVDISSKHKIERYEEGYRVVTQMFYDHPCVYMFVHRGLFSMNAKDYDKALKDFEKALEIEPSNQFAFNNIGCINKYLDNNEKAIIYLKRAIRYMDDEPNHTPYVNLAHTYERMGEYEWAARTRQALIERFPDIRNDMDDDLRFDYSRAGQTEKALNLVDNEPSHRYMEEREVYINADMPDEAEKALNKYYTEAVKRSSPRISGDRMLKYKRAYAWHCLIKGRYFEAIKNIKAVYDANDKGKDCEPAHEVWAEILFMLSIQDDAAGYEASRSYGIVPKPDIAFEDSFSIAAKLNGRINMMRTAGDAYLYKTKELNWLMFLISYFTEGFEDNESKLEQLCTSIRCRACKNPSCAKLTIARAMLLEKRGRKEEAVQLYRQLQKEQPYDWYSKAKLVYLT